MVPLIASTVVVENKPSSVKIAIGTSLAWDHVSHRTCETGESGHRMPGVGLDHRPLNLGKLADERGHEAAPAGGHGFDPYPARADAFQDVAPEVRGNALLSRLGAHPRTRGTEGALGVEFVAEEPHEAFTVFRQDRELGGVGKGKMASHLGR